MQIFLAHFWYRARKILLPTTCTGRATLESLCRVRGLHSCCILPHCAAPQSRLTAPRLRPRRIRAAVAGPPIRIVSTADCHRARARAKRGRPLAAGRAGCRAQRLPAGRGLPGAHAERTAGGSDPAASKPQHRRVCSTPTRLPPSARHAGFADRLRRSRARRRAAPPPRLV